MKMHRWILLYENWVTFVRKWYLLKKRLAREDAVNDSKVILSARLVKGSRPEATPDTRKKHRMVIFPDVSYTKQTEVDAVEEGEGSNDMMFKLSQLMTTLEEVKSMCEYNSKKFNGLHKVMC